ncbi:MAG: Crp/Fnr family transcriptional regulator [Clostridia bacterium]|jgi:CRP-like cAMP-binding protein|nr:Crp/Fnr family transcriptional regulator [Clostridia bacterium]
MAQQWLKTLEKCPLFQEITAEELSCVLDCLQPKIKNYKGRDICITLEGEKFSGVGVVLSGEVAVTKENVEGNRVMMTKLGAGGLFGEIAAFSGKRVWPATVVTLGACHVMFVPINKIVDSCAKHCPSHRQLILNMLKIVSNRTLMLNRKLEYLAIKSMRGKISTFLLEQYKKAGQKKFKLSLTRQELADFLNVSRPSLSREMCRMRDEGVIEFKRELIEIRDLKALKRATW